MKWKPEDKHHDVVVNPYTLTFEAGDTQATHVTIWNVTKREVKLKFGGTGRSVRDDLYFAVESMNAEKSINASNEWISRTVEILIIQKQFKA